MGVVCVVEFCYLCGVKIELNIIIIYIKKDKK